MPLALQPLRAAPAAWPRWHLCWQREQEGVVLVVPARGEEEEGVPQALCLLLDRLQSLVKVVGVICPEEAVEAQAEAAAAQVGLGALKTMGLPA